MRKEIIVNEVFSELLKPYNSLDYFTTSPTGANENFNQVRNYIDDSKNPMELGSNVANNNTPFKNTKEHREHYRAIKDGGFGDHYADIYYSVAYAEMQRVHKAELKHANDIMAERLANAKFGDVPEDLVEKVTLKQDFEKDIFNFRDKVVRNVAPTDEEYLKLQSSLKAFKSFDNPNYAHEFEQQILFKERLAENPEQTISSRKSYGQELEQNKYEWKVQELENNVLAGYNEELRVAYPNKVAGIENKINMFNTNPEFKKNVMEPILDGVQDKDFQYQRKLNNPEIQPVVTTTQSVEVPAQVQNDLYAETGGVKIDKAIYQEALTIESEIGDIFNSMKNGEQPSIANNNELKQPEIATPTPLQAEAINSPGMEQKQPAPIHEDYNPFDDKHIDQWNKDFAAQYQKVANSPEYAKFREGLNLKPIPEYQPTQFGPSNAHTEDIKQDNGISFVMKDWDLQSREVKTALFNQEQRWKEEGTEFKSTIPEANNKVMTEEYYTKHPEKKALVEQIQAIRNSAKEAIKQDKSLEHEPEHEEVNEAQNSAKHHVAKKIQSMRVQYI